MSRQDVAEYLLMVLGWVGLECNRDILIDTVRHWASTAELSFADAYPRCHGNAAGISGHTKNLNNYAEGVYSRRP